MKYPSKEWSGILFYTATTPLNTVGEVHLIGHYLYLLDIGSGAWTEYEPSTHLMDVYDAFPEAIEWMEGHIHSHHNMAAFFSGTDDSTVIEHGSQVESFLSLIVSTSMKYAAKFARKVKSEIKYSVHGTGASQTAEQWFVGLSDCEVTLPVVEHDTLLTLQIERLEKEKVAAAKKSVTIYPVNNGFAYSDPPALTDKRIISFLSKWLSLDELYNGSMYSALREAQKIANEEQTFEDLYYEEALTSSFEELFENIFKEEATYEMLAEVKKKLAYYISINGSACKFATEHFLKRVLDECITFYQQPISYV